MHGATHIKIDLVVHSTANINCEQQYAFRSS
jgi:hypothetical protein